MKSAIAAPNTLQSVTLRMRWSQWGTCATQSAMTATPAATRPTGTSGFARHATTGSPASNAFAARVPPQPMQGSPINSVKRHFGNAPARADNAIAAVTVARKHQYFRRFSTLLKADAAPRRPWLRPETLVVLLTAETYTLGDLKYTSNYGVSKPARSVTWPHRKSRAPRFGMAIFFWRQAGFAHASGRA